MSQFEYNDLNKFFVSIGIFLIGLTFLMPWLFLKEDFDLLIKSSELQSFTEVAQGIIKKRQFIASTFSIIVPIVSLCSFCFGIFLIYKGINGWRKLQRNNEYREQLINKKLTLEIENLDNNKITEAQTLEFKDQDQNKNISTISNNEKISEEYVEIPINNLWKLNHWGSDCASIENGKMIFKGTKTRLETDGSHINLPNILKVGKVYEVSCFVKAQQGTTSKFQLWCHDKVGTKPYGSKYAIPYAVPSLHGDWCKLRFEAKYNSNLRIHLQYLPGEGCIEVRDIRITELYVPDK